MKIYCIVDFEGFLHKNRMLIKEVCFRFNSRVVRHYFYKLPRVELFSNQERYNFDWASVNIHSLAYENSPTDLPIKYLYKEISDICEKAKQLELFIAYKGNKHIKRMFNNMGYDDLLINLDNLSCLNFKTILNNSNELMQQTLYSLICPRHDCNELIQFNNLLPVKQIQCPLAKTYAYYLHLRAMKLMN